MGVHIEKMQREEIDLLDKLVNTNNKSNVKIVETKDGLVITAEILGFCRDDIYFTRRGRRLTITGKKKSESTSENGNGESFSLSLRLPEHQKIITDSRKDLT